MCIVFDRKLSTPNLGVRVPDADFHKTEARRAHVLTNTWRPMQVEHSLARVYQAPQTLASVLTRLAGGLTAAWVRDSRKSAKISLARPWTLQLSGLRPIRGCRPLQTQSRAVLGELQPELLVAASSRSSASWWSKSSAGVACFVLLAQGCAL